MAGRRMMGGGDMWAALNPENPRPDGDVLAAPAHLGEEFAGAAGAPVRRPPLGQGQNQPQPPGHPFPEIRRQTTPRAAKRFDGPIPNLFPPAPMAMLPGGGGGGGSAEDSRFRSIEKQCHDLREEQRQLAGWLSKTQEDLAREGRLRQEAENALSVLDTRLGMSHSELDARLSSAEQQNQSLQDAMAWAQNANQQELSRVASEVGGLSLELQNVGSMVKVQQDTLTQVTDELSTLERLSRTVSFLQERTEVFNRTLDQRLRETETQAKSLAEGAESRADEAIKQAQYANKATLALEQHVQRTNDQLNESMRRLETSLKTELMQQITARSRDVSEGMVAEMEAKLMREVDAVTSSSAKDTTATLRREIEDQIRGLGEGVRDAQAQRAQQDEQMRSDLRGVLVQQKNAVQQSVDETGKRLRAMDEALRAESNARQALEESTSQLQEAQRNTNAREEEAREELLAIEESLEAGLAELRGELSSAVGALAASTDERDRERGHEISRLHADLSGQLASLKQKDSAFFDTSKQISAIADATRANAEKHINIAQRTDRHDEALQQMRHVVARIEERHHRLTSGGVDVSAFGGAGGGSGGGGVPVGSEELVQRMAAALQSEGKGSWDDPTTSGFPALRNLWKAFEEMDGNWDMLEQQLAQATEERRLNAETIAGTGESLEAIINRLALCEESLASLIPAFVAGEPLNEPQHQQHQQHQHEEEAAAVRIQARRRGMNARRSVRGTASDRGSPTEDAFEEGRRNAATKIQAMQRGRATRRGSDIAQPPTDEVAPASAAADPSDYEARSPSPEPLVDEMAAGIQAEDEAAANKAAAERLRPHLEADLVTHGLVWEHVVPALELLGIEELTAGFDEPGAILSKLTSAVGPVGKAMLVAKLRPTLEPRLLDEGMQWDDVVPALELVSIDELQAAVSDPEANLGVLVSGLLVAGRQDDDDDDDDDDLG